MSEKQRCTSYTEQNNDKERMEHEAQTNVPQPSEAQDNEPQELEAISAELEALGQDSLDECFNILAEGEELWPFVAYETKNGKRFALSFTDDDKERCLEEARNFLSQEADLIRYTLVYEGFIKDDEDELLQEALLFEFSEQGMQAAYSGYCLYEHDEISGQCYCSQPYPAGIVDSLL